MFERTGRIGSRARDAGLVIALGALLVGCASAAPSASTPVPATPTPSPKPSPSASAAVAPAPTGPIPSPFGLAANGLVLYSTTDGDIVSIDPETGNQATIIGGPTYDEAPGLSPDGRRFSFGRRSASGGIDVWVASIDGSGATMVIPGPVPPEWMWWAPASDRLGIVPNGGGEAAVFDVVTGARTTVDVPDPVHSLAWKSDDTLVLGMQADGPQGPTTFATANVDGSDLKTLPTAADATYASSISPDGTRLAYMTWGTTPESQGQIHVLDLASGKDVVRTPVDPGFNWEEPVFSPDGRWIKVDRYDATETPLQLALLPADGDVKPLVLGPAQSQQDDGTSTIFSPDGSKLLATYNAARETLLVDIASKEASKVDWPGLGPFASWQRVAP